MKKSLYCGQCAEIYGVCHKGPQLIPCSLEEIPNYADAMMLQRYTAVFGHLAYSLREYQTAMLDFAEKSDGNEADRTAEGFARMFGSYFPPEFSITEGNAWMSTLNNSVQYVSVIRPGEKLQSSSSESIMYPLWGCSGLISLRACVSVMHRRNVKFAANGF